MSERYDVIIIGAGHNGLVCASILAQEGRTVLVLEANSQLGGLAATHEFAPEFKISACAHLLYGLHPKVYEKCNLSQAGLEFSNKNLPTIIVNEQRHHVRFSSGTTSILTGDDTIEHNDNGSTPVKADKKTWNAFEQRMNKFSKVLFSLADKAPPRLRHGRVQDYKTLLSTGLDLRRLGKQDLRQFLRIIGMNVFDLVEENFASSLVKAAICYDAILGSRLGPRAPNTVYNWLNRKSIANQNERGLLIPAGGMGAISDALAKEAKHRGAEVITGCKVSSIQLIENRVSGVELESGERFSANCVVSNADIKHTMLSLVGAQNLETDFVKRLNWIPMQGNCAKLHIALSHLPDSITGQKSDFDSRIIYAPSPEAIERASNSIKYKEYSDDPVFELTVPSVRDRSLSPSGKHVMSVLIPYVPYQHKNGWDQEHDNFEKHMLGKLGQLMPGLETAIESVETLTPLDIEQRFNVTGGHWHHGEIGLERFLMTRPMPGYAQYATPIDGLYLCGADCHPGGDVTGAPGLNAAKAVSAQKS